MISKKTISLFVLLALGCQKEKTEPLVETKTNAATPAATGASAAGNGTAAGTGTAAPAADVCEVSVNGAPAKKNTGFVSSKRWGDEVEWPAKIFCPDMDLVGYGDDSTLPMKAGKYPFYQPGGAKSGVFALYGFEEYSVSGEVNIESWDDSGIKGSYEAKGAVGVPGTSTFKDGVTIKGTFSSKKPMARHKPFQAGYCEYTVNDGLPRREPGGSFAFASAHWPPASGVAPSYPLQLNCGRYNFSANGDLKNFPMKPAKYQVSAKNEDGSLSLISPLSSPAGGISIETFDDKSLKGSFELKGPRMFSSDSTVLTVRGVFDFKRP